MPLIRGEVNELNRGHLHGEHLEYCHFLVDHTEKFIWHYRMGVKEYYDLQEDPWEDVAVAKPAIADGLREVLHAEIPTWRIP